MLVTPPSHECPACGSAEFYGFSTVIETYCLTQDGPHVTETDGGGSVERIQCATCEAEFDVTTFFEAGRAVLMVTDDV